ncbi:uncharacterized protein involved in exopolysaccharide biosynthesis [Bradyrhizobium sp. USDA 10063]
MRQDLLDEVVWKEIARLLEDRQLIEDELERRLKAARNADPTQRREETLRRDLARSRKSIERLLTAYQESLLSLDELHSRMRTRAKRDLRGTLLPSRQVIVRQCLAGRLKARSLTLIGWCSASRRSCLVGRPRPGT